MAEHDWNRAEAIFRWPLEEFMEGLIACLKAKALKEYRFELLMWVLAAPHSKKRLKQPAIPDILRV